MCAQAEGTELKSMGIATATNLGGEGKLCTSAGTAHSASPLKCLQSITNMTELLEVRNIMQPALRECCLVAGEAL
jgi:hypothetical protein